MIGSIVALELGVAAGVVTTEQGTVGGVGGIGFSFAPWFRLRVPVHFQIWPDRVWEFGTGFAFDFSLSLVTMQTWLEFGFAGRAQARGFFSLGAAVLAGADLHMAIFQALGDSTRFFVRAEGMALGNVSQASELDYGIYLSTGLAVVL